MSKTRADKGKELVIKAALRAYRGELLPVDFEKMDLEQLVEAAKKNEFGDTLVSFIIHELNEGLDGEDWDRAAELIERGRDDLDAVLGGLYAVPTARKK
jgi:hypothetical protein